MINPDGSPNTAHTTNPVPFILVDNDQIRFTMGVLGDVAPTILELMGIENRKSWQEIRCYKLKMNDKKNENKLFLVFFINKS
jgi:2,3-bisphosphoglycerate-independent phosphoglycerate mutase